MYNVIIELIRRIIMFCILIDVIIMICKEFVSFVGVFFLGIFDYDLIYVMIYLKNKRFFLKIIRI